MTAFVAPSVPSVEQNLLATLAVAGRLISLHVRSPGLLRTRSAVLCALLSALPGFAVAQGAASLVSQSEAAQPATLELVQTAPKLRPLEAEAYGRVERTSDGMYRYQWPGVYFLTAFHGRELYFRLGEGDQHLRLAVDGKSLTPLEKPTPGLYRLTATRAGDHTVRIDVLNENQDAPKLLGGFALTANEHGVRLPAASRQIEFIGDSHTVGYGNTSGSRKCTAGEIWSTTDASQSIGADVARHYNANYAVEAISGHGVVRNYDGMQGDPVPVAYPFLFLDKKTPYVNPAWHPSVIAISLGTNDFSTALKPEEQWKSREELHGDYERTYIAFVNGLRQRNPGALFVLWSTDKANGEISAEVGHVVQKLHRGGDGRVAALEVSGLAFSGCDWHPSVADDRAIAEQLIGVIDKGQVAW